MALTFRAFDTVRLSLLTAVLATASLVATSETRSPQAPPAPALDTTLRAAGAYVDRFPLDAAGIVLEETYVQQTKTVQLTTRRLRSDVLLMAAPDEGWIEFRDVFEVDGKPVRDRDDRLAELFAQPNVDARQQARRIVADGARFNLSPDGMRISRTLNVATAGLYFLRPANQRRSSFSRNGFATIDETRVAVVEFKETAKPRMIGTADQAAAHGTFWIAPETGVVLRSLLKLTTGRSEAQTEMTARVDYAQDPRFKIWLPRAMEEHYEVVFGNGPEEAPSSQGRLITPQLGTSNITIDGHATYSNIRRFSVAVDETPAR